MKVGQVRYPTVDNVCLFVKNRAYVETFRETLAVQHLKVLSVFYISGMGYKSAPMEKQKFSKWKQNIFLRLKNFYLAASIILSW